MRNKLFATAKGVISLSWCIAVFSLFVAVTANGTLSASTTLQISTGLQTSPDLNGFAGGKASSSNSIKAKFIMDNGESIEVESKDDIPIDWDKYKEMPVVKCVIYDNEIRAISEKSSENELKLKVKNTSLRFRQTAFVYKIEGATPKVVVTSTIVLYCVVKGLWSGSLAVWREYEDKKNSDFLTYAEIFSISFTKGFIFSFAGVFGLNNYYKWGTCATSVASEVGYLYSNVNWSGYNFASWFGYISFFRDNFDPSTSDWTSVFWTFAGCAGL